MLNPAVEAIVQPYGSSERGAELNRLLVEGVQDISTLCTVGLVGFPSFHTVMALTTIIAVWPYRGLRILLVPICAILLPGILIHGGRHLVDVVGGATLTIVSWL